MIYALPEKLLDNNYELHFWAICIQKFVFSVQDLFIDQIFDYFWLLLTSFDPVWPHLT